MSLDARIQLRLGELNLDATIVAQNGTTALFGPSGAGKTTVLRAIAGLARPDAGHVSLGGRVLFDAASGIDLGPELRGIGFVFQDARLFPHMNVGANLRYGWRRTPRRLLDIDAVVELLGIGALLDRRPASLSGGERQRVAIGRALLRSPDLLVLDEPLSSVDRARRDDILPFLDRLRRESRVPILLVTHEPDEILRLADQVVVIDGGRTIAAGPVAEMFAGSELGAVLGRGERGSVLEGEVVSVGDDGLATVAIPAATVEIASGSLVQGQRVRLRIRASDVALARGEIAAISVRNRFAAVIRSIDGDATGPSAEVTLDAGANRLLARVTKRSIAELALRPGDRVTALVKAVSVERAF